MKKIAVINDLSGFGKCSLAVSLPIISVLGIECHPLPTSVLSTQTGYDTYELVEMDPHIESFANDWKNKGFSFDGIFSGYASNITQLKHISKVIDIFKNSKNILLVDPVMGDDGKLYNGYTDEMVNAYRELSYKADIITPNETELFLLTGEKDIEKAAKIMLDKGIKNVIVTGIKRNNNISNALFTKDYTKYYDSKYLSSKSGGSFSGTGDIFASIIIGKVVKGVDIVDAVDDATSFIYRCIRDSHIVNRNDGIDFEKHLKEL